MISTTFNSAPAFLLDDAPDWSTAIKLDSSIPAAFERGLTGCETRRPTGDTLRLELTYSAVVETPALQSLRNSLQALNVQPVLCPMWTHPFAGGSTPPVTAAWYATFSNGAFNALVPSSTINSQSSSLTCYPLLVGRLSEVPDPTALNANTVRVSFKFIENADFPVTPPALTLTNALNDASGSPRPLMPVHPDWGSAPHTGAAEADLDRRKIGNLRSTADAYYDQPSRRMVTQSFSLSGGWDLKLLAFWLQSGGQQENFWLPAALIEANLTHDVAAGDTALQVDNDAALGTNTAILLRTPGLAPLAVNVSSVSTGVWHLAAAVGATYCAAHTSLESLALCRFNTLKLSLTYTAPCLATGTVKFIEVSAEVAAIYGETIGSTFGALPITATFFLFTMTTPSNVSTWYYTNFERDLTDGTNTWVSAPMEYDSITETADLKRNTTNLKSRNFAGNPLALLFPLALEWPLMVQIFEVDVTATLVGGLNQVANQRCYFYGEVGTADLEPPFITAQCQTLSHIFDRQLPRRLYQQPDNWCLFESANGLTPGEWEWTGQVASETGLPSGYNAATGTLLAGSLHQTTTTGPYATLAAAGGSTAHWYAGGYLILTPAGYSAGTTYALNAVVTDTTTGRQYVSLQNANTGHAPASSPAWWSPAANGQQVRMIADNSAADSSGVITFNLSTPFNTAPAVGDSVKLYPGYDGQATTATTKFGNYQQKFGGFPFIPIGNPTVLRITQPSGAGKK